MKTTVYETIWRNKWITSNANSIDEMIGSLMRCIEELQEMKKDGIEGDFQGAGDDYIWFRTEDQVKAEKYGMSEMEDWDEEEDDDLDSGELLDDTVSDQSYNGDLDEDA